MINFTLWAGCHFEQGVAELRAQINPLQGVLSQKAKELIGDRYNRMSENRRGIGAY